MSNDNPDTAALDLDAIRKRAVLYRANQMQHEKTYDRAAGLTAAAFLCAQDVPTLLDALAAAREELARFGTNAELLSCSTMGDAFDRMEQTVRERDAAREELAEAKREVRALNNSDDGRVVLLEAELARMTERRNVAVENAQQYRKNWDSAVAANMTALETIGTLKAQRDAVMTLCATTPDAELDTLPQRVREAYTVPAAAPQADDGPGHCGLCGSEDCPGKPGKGCTPGPFEAYEPKATGGIVTNPPPFDDGPAALVVPTCRTCGKPQPCGIKTPHPIVVAVPGGGEQAATTSHGWTSHGYACCGEAKTGERPNARARCMGNPGCAKCKAEAERIHAALPTSGQA